MYNEKSQGVLFIFSHCRPYVQFAVAVPQKVTLCGIMQPSYYEIVYVM